MTPSIWCAPSSKKPTAERAATYLAAGNYLWNSGMFFFPARRILDELRENLPALGGSSPTSPPIPVAPPVATPSRQPSRSTTPSWRSWAPSASGGASHPRARGRLWLERCRIVRCDGCTEPPDAAGNHASLSPEVAHPPIFVSAHRNIVCQSGTQIVAALGVDDLVIAVTKDAVLVLPRERAQDVRGSSRA